MTLQCPKCSSRAVRPSQYKSRTERALSLAFCHPFRCRHCGHRFFEFATKEQRKSMLVSRLSARLEQAFAVLPSEF